MFCVEPVRALPRKKKPTQVIMIGQQPMMTARWPVRWSWQDAGGGKAVKNLEHVFRCKIDSNDKIAENVLKMVTGQQDPKDIGVVSFVVDEPEDCSVLNNCE